MLIVLSVSLFLVLVSFFILFVHLENAALESIKPNFVILIYQFIKDVVTYSSVSLTIGISLLVISAGGIMLFCLNYFFTLKKIQQAVDTVNAGDFTARIPIKGKTGDITTTLFADFNRMIKMYRKKIAMQKYVSDSTAKMLENVKTGEFASKPIRKNATIFFSDVRKFTAFSEKHDPLIVVNRLNEIFNIQVRIITKFRGDIDKFVGDEIMAVFSTPGEAFKASVEIQNKMAAYNKRKKEPLPIGIGINYGEVVVGAIGGGDSLDWTIVGDAVNIAARLCSMAEGGQICVSEIVFKKAKTTQKHISKSIKVKGRKHMINTYIFSKRK